MPVYENVPKEIPLLVASVMEKFHAKLVEVELKVDVLYATACTNEQGEVRGPALKLHGVTCMAIAKIVGLKDRAKGNGDVEIHIDGDRWGDLSEEEQIALIDHELYHFELCYDKEGTLRSDDRGRPKVRIRQHDHSFGWFDCIAERHGTASLEVQQYREFNESHRQTWLAFEKDTPASKARGGVTGGAVRKAAAASK